MLTERKKWLIWLVMTLVFMISMLQRFVAGVLQKDLMIAFNMSAAEYGWLASIYMYVFMAMQFIIGPLLDTKGARVTSAVGMCVACLGSVIFGCSLNVPMLFVGRMMIAIGFSGAYATCVKVNAANFEPVKFASVMGLTSFFGQLGSIAAQSPLAWMIASVGWRMIFIMIGAATLLFSIITMKALKSSDEQTSAAKERFTLHSIINRSVLTELSEVIKVPHMKHLVVNAFGGQGISTMLIAAWCVPFLRDVYDISLIQASNKMVYFLIGQMTGCLLLGIISDRLGNRKKVYTVVNIIATIIFAKVFLIPPLLPLYCINAVFVVFGFCSSSYIIRIAIGKELCDSKHTGSSFTVVNAGTFFGAAVSTTVTGMIFNWSQRLFQIATAYRIAFLPAAVAVLAFLLTTLVVPETFKKQR